MPILIGKFPLLRFETSKHNTTSKTTNITHVKTSLYFHFGLRNGIENVQKL